MVRIAVAAVLCAVLWAGAGHAQSPPASDIRYNLAYGPDPVQRLDLCLPAGGGAARPAVVMIHGGYWTVGDKSAYAGPCGMAANLGVVAAAIDYRLATGDPRNRWPAQLVDAQLAVRWLRAHAGEFGVDAAHICVLGDSAGAHLALLVAAADRTAPGDYAGTLAGVSSKVACVVDAFGPSDISADNFWPPEKQLFGSDGQTRPTDQERAASPLYVANPAMPPVMIIQGRDDKNVPLGQSQQLYDRLKQLHVPVRMTLFNGGHEFAGLAVPDIVAIYQSAFDFIKRPKG